jgi:hypothetical protein
MGARDAIARGAGLLLATALWLAPATGHAVSEYQVKAAFLLNFGKFVEWPAQALPAGALDICVLGHDPFGSELDDTLAGRTVGSRSVQARRIADVSAARQCAIVFVSRADADSVAAVLASLRGAPVLLGSTSSRWTRRSASRSTRPRPSRPGSRSARSS